MVAAGVLVAASTALSGRVVTEVKAGWREPCPLWVAVVAPSGDGKSPTASRISHGLLAPIENTVVELADAAVRESTGLDRETATTRRATLDRALKRADSTLADALAEGADPDTVAELTGRVDDLARQRDALRIPPVPRPFVDDITPEALHGVLSRNGGRATAWVVEGSGLFHRLAGREAANVAPWLAAADGEPLRSDRVTVDRPDVEAAYLTMGMFVQPKVLGDGITGDALSYNGFAQRFLYAAPASRLGTRSFDAPAPDEWAEAELSTRLCSIARRTWPADEPIVLPLDDAARRRFAEYWAVLEARNPDADPVPEMTSKLLGKVARLSGIFALLDNAEAESIGVEHVDAAHAVAQWFHGQAVELWGRRLTADGAHAELVDGLCRLVRRVVESGRTRVRISDGTKYGNKVVREATRSADVLDRRNPATRRWTAAWTVLVEAGWVVPVIVNGTLRGYDIVLSTAAVA